MYCVIGAGSNQDRILVMSILSDILILVDFCKVCKAVVILFCSVSDFCCIIEIIADTLGSDWVDADTNRTHVEKKTITPIRLIRRDFMVIAKQSK